MEAGRVIAYFSEKRKQAREYASQTWLISDVFLKLLIIAIRTSDGGASSIFSVVLQLLCIALKRELWQL